ncbi:MAG: acyl-CoA carboxylase subunit epsilon [Bowdeniella nasicola]|nr:acyl-CoA carboxylase subunit epsilon [Bowdeniella nasicola]
MPEVPDLHIVAGTPEADEIAALVAGLHNLAASLGPCQPAQGAESEWQRRARPAVRGYGLHCDAWLWSAR